MMLRWMTAGESHGQGLAGIISGLPAGCAISIERVNAELYKRQQGIGRSKRQEIERDTANFIAGIRHGVTIGSPIAVLIENKDHENWRDVMSVEPPEMGESEKQLAMPRPGHADLAGMLKWGLSDARNILERASGRSTAVEVALGAVCRQYLECFGCYIGGRIIKFGSYSLYGADELTPSTRADIDDPESLLSYGKTTDEQRSMMEKVVDDARKSGDTVGGVIQVVAAHVVPGLGSCANADERLDSRLASAVMGIPGIKAMEIGSGIAQASLGGKETHDRYAREDDPDCKPWYGRSTNYAGGIEGGITNGEPIFLTAWMKPLATINPPNVSIDPGTKFSVTPESSERSDVAAVESVACVMEAVVAMELARSHLDKLGGDTMSEVEYAVEKYLESIGL